MTRDSSDHKGGSAPETLSTQSLVATVQTVAARFEEDAASVRREPTPERVEHLRLAYLGRKGQVTALLEGMRTCPKEERPVAGKAINDLKGQVERTMAALKDAATLWAVEARLKEPPLDITLPVEAPHVRGSLHPVTLMRRELLREFRRLGFTVYDGPEVDFESYNFNRLNMPSHHPARDMQDTFYVADGDQLLLRTHTSNVQIHAMLRERPPLRIVAPGRVFRVDSDPTHTPMFHQIEGFVVDQKITFAHMKGVIDSFVKAIFGPNVKTRFRPAYFPFVEPGAELDVQCVQCGGRGCRLCKETGWLEMGGAGMIHPNVFEAVDYDSQAYTGFAFGFGIDRMAMVKYRVPDLRQLFEGHHSYLGQFPAFT